jgi:putative restriction endonuclease
LKNKHKLLDQEFMLNSKDQAYKIIRELSFLTLHYISVIKLLDDKGKLNYYFRLFADYFGEVQHPYTIEKEQEQIEAEN